MARKRARGDTRTLLQYLGAIQVLAGRAWAEHQNDRSQMGFANGQKALERIQALCLEASDPFDPVYVKDEMINGNPT